MHAIAIIAAAGYGKRFKGKIPKQFIKIDGKPLLYYTLKAFSGSKIDGIVLVVSPHKIKYCERLVEEYDIKKILGILPGGITREDSVHNGFRALPKDTEIVVIHDGVRPFVTKKMIEETILYAESSGAAVLGVPPKNTIKEINKNWIKKTLNRGELAEIQTPQAFRYSILENSYKRFKDKLGEVTDTSCIVEKAGYKVRIVNGDYKNIKVTTKDDLDIVYPALKQKLQRTGIGYDIHRLARFSGRQANIRDFILGGVRIQSPYGLIGHSDSDVLLHALTDAVLGGIGEHDIGWHFPNTDIRYKNMESKHFLLKARELLQNRKYKILSIDSIILAQHPRLQPYHNEMIDNISNWLDLTKDRIAIKFCTTEGLGPVGHKKAVAAFAVVNIANI